MVNKYRYQSKFEIYFRKYLFLTLLVAMSAVTMYFANYLIKQAQTYKAGAAAGNAQFFFEPSSLSLAPSNNVNLWVTVDKALGFVRAELSFDPSLLKLTQEISLGTPSLNRIVKLTSMAEANSTGKIAIILGLDPSMLSVAQSGSFKLATLNLATKVTTPNVSTSVQLVTNNLQLVDTGATVFTTTSTPLNLTLNPAASPTPTPTPTSSPIATLAPTGSSDKTTPTVTITSPQNGASLSGNTKVAIAATASDNIGVTQVQFLVNNIVICTDTAAPYTCDWQTPKGRKSSDLKAVASDAAGNTASSSVAVNTK